MQILLQDVVGNPVPPGSLVTVSASGEDTVLATGYADADGAVSSDAVQPGQTYVVSIAGELVLPVASGGGTYEATVTANADGSATVVVFEGYDSCFRSPAGMLLEMRSRWRDGRGTWPRKVVGPQGNLTPVATCLGAAFAAPPAVVDRNLREILAAVRFGSSSSSMALLQGFATDLLGTWGLPLPFESLPNYANRVSLLLRRDRVTIPAIRDYVNAFVVSEADVPVSTTGLAEDVSGGEDSAGGEDVLPAPAQGAAGSSAGELGEDTSGGEDTTTGGEDTAAVPSSMPTVRVFDHRTDPATAAAVPVTNPDGTHGIQRNQVCIYFVYRGYENTPTVTEPYAQPLEATLLACFVAAGTDIVWATNKPAS